MLMQQSIGFIFKSSIGGPRHIKNVMTRQLGDNLGNIRVTPSRQISNEVTVETLSAAAKEEITRIEKQIEMFIADSQLASTSEEKSDIRKLIICRSQTLNALISQNQPASGNGIHSLITLTSFFNFCYFHHMVSIRVAISNPGEDEIGKNSTIKKWKIKDQADLNVRMSRFKGKELQLVDGTLIDNFDDLTEGALYIAVNEFDHEENRYQVQDQVHEMIASEALLQYVQSLGVENARLHQNVIIYREGSKDVV